MEAVMGFFYHWIYRPLRPGRRFYCRNVFEGKNSLIFSDGGMICVCSDHLLETRGNINDTSINEIWHGPKYEELRDSFRRNRLPLHRCPFCFALEKIPKSAPDPFKVAPFLWNIHLETTPICNLDCMACPRDVVIGHRGRTRLSRETVYRLLDEVIEHRTTKYFLFFGFGEPLLDNHTYEYVQYLKKGYPEITVSISTNGIALAHERNVEKLLDTPLDLLSFSIDGSNEKEYLRYQRGGDFKRAMAGMRQAVKRRNERGQKNPYIVWQYLLFRWNDSTESIRRTLDLARETGVDLLHFLPVRRPITGISWRNVIRRESWGAIYKFGPLDHNYNPHDRAKIIRVSDNTKEIPLYY
jgi:MoaA/NifB/PqqE/SkfB family radical SAM enzyme